ncbi:MAG: AmmeMemoRadiSam system protein B [Deltaproteobacteria bacterium CG_4_9_14_3_um_filter_63_12]|nr:MAG: AmmeMemoRadiSam system protein B [Deltaproteobacteria bacterium CG_4_9_14_3_um_filter_63_12]
MALPQKPKLRRVLVSNGEHGGEPVVLVQDPENDAPGVAVLPVRAASLLGLLDGVHDVASIARRFAELSGEEVEEARVEAWIAGLDRALMLEGDAIERAKRARIAAYEGAATRPMAFADRVYPAHPESCAERLGAWLEQATRAAEAAGEPTSGGEPAALFVPHVDYARGGAVYASAYQHLVAAEPADTYVILGTLHASSRRQIILTSKDHETPFGRLEVCKESIARLRKRFGSQLFEEEFRHGTEHSIELQAVWLAYLHRHFERKPRIVPILCGSMFRWIRDGVPPSDQDNYTRFLALMWDVLRSVPGRVRIIAAGDLSHQGPAHGDDDGIPEADMARHEARDRRSLSALATGDSARFFADVAEDRDRRRICGLSPGYAMLRMLGGAVQGEVVGYGAALDSAGNRVSFGAVTYCSR